MKKMTNSLRLPISLDDVLRGKAAYEQAILELETELYCEVI